MRTCLRAQGGNLGHLAPDGQAPLFFKLCQGFRDCFSAVVLGFIEVLGRVVPFVGQNNIGRDEELNERRRLVDLIPAQPCGGDLGLGDLALDFLSPHSVVGLSGTPVVASHDKCSFRAVQACP